MQNDYKLLGKFLWMGGKKRSDNWKTPSPYALRVERFFVETRFIGNNNNGGELPKYICRTQVRNMSHFKKYLS